MKRIKSIAKDIELGKDLDKNVKAYGEGMMSLYNRFSHIRLAMNYYVFKEMNAEEPLEVKDKTFYSLYNQLEEIINTGNVTVEDLDKMRNQIIKQMDVITSYVDKFTLYEYILNRVEYRFSDEKPDLDYYNSRFTNDIMHFIIGDKDSAVTNARISQIVGQLPVRITKARFYDLLKDAIMLYKGAQTESVDDFMYVLRTVSTVDIPKGFVTKFKSLNSTYNQLVDADYKNMTKEEYERLTYNLNMAVTFVQQQTDLYVSLIEIINDMYVVLLAKPYARLDKDDEAMFNKVMEVAKSGDLDPDMAEDVFIGFEGKQEDIFMDIAQNDYLIEQLTDVADEYKDMFEALKKIVKLSSGNYFVALKTKKNATKLADETYVLKTFESFKLELDELFEGKTNIIKRAIMAAVLAALPVFFNNIDEIQEYVNVSLMQCKDSAEQIACMKLINMIMED